MKTPMRALVKRFCICCVLVMHTQANAVEIHYDDLTKLIAEKNGHVLAAESDVQAFEAETGFLARSYLPQLTGALGVEKFKTGVFELQTQPFGSLEANLNLFRGGRDLLESKVRDLRLDVARTELNQRMRDELLEARKEYFSVLYAEEVLASLQEALILNENNLSSAKRRVGAGMGAETDRYEFDIYRTQIEQDIARLELQRQNSLRFLMTLFGMEAGETLALKPPEHAHDESFLQESLTQENELNSKRESLSENIFLLQSSQANRWWVPSLDVFASHSLYTLRERDYALRSDRYESVVGAKLSFVFFDGLAGRTQAVADALRSQAHRLKSVQTYRESYANFSNAQTQLKLTHELVHGTERNVEQSKKYLHGTLSEYQRGLKNSPDVLSASQRFLEFRRRLAELKREYGTASAELYARLNK